MAKFEIMYKETAYKTAYVEAENLAEATHRFCRDWLDGDLEEIKVDTVRDLSMHNIYDENNNVLWSSEVGNVPEGCMIADPDCYGQYDFIKNVNGTVCYTTIEYESYNRKGE